ncbi:TIGR03905 family TSCPD domain-containing protein [Thermohalobacter berrensis]|uniref:ribonucleoside-diphosphate reductase n=1 Tax=Thermohalobacter berrensis TaxID=99594 RepID=A0A419SU93_9FIRM|nr:TIGR03905 family TSCPD domain-containing protein [Thermohalobacter berrensis]RKD28775.1 TIGR03905 family protein [Thermohalobacter berrensis]
METYIPEGVCAKKITYKIKDGIVENVTFHSGCPGSLQGVSKLVEGKPVQEVAKTLKGIRCGFKSTSCPDQLSKVLEKYIKSK